MSQTLTISPETMEKILEHFDIQTVLYGKNKRAVLDNMRGYFKALLDFDIITEEERSDLVLCLLHWYDTGVFITKET